MCTGYKFGKHLFVANDDKDNGECGECDSLSTLDYCIPCMVLFPCCEGMKAKYVKMSHDIQTSINYKMHNMKILILSRELMSISCTRDYATIIHIS